MRNRLYTECPKNVLTHVFHDSSYFQNYNNFKSFPLNCILLRDLFLHQWGIRFVTKTPMSHMLFVTYDRYWGFKHFKGLFLSFLKTILGLYLRAFYYICFCRHCLYYHYLIVNLYKAVLNPQFNHKLQFCRIHIIKASLKYNSQKCRVTKHSLAKWHTSCFCFVPL